MTANLANLNETESEVIFATLWHDEKRLSKMLDDSTAADDAGSVAFWKPRVTEVRAILRKLFPAEAYRWPEITG